MSKSKLDKLKEFIGTVRNLLTETVVGEAPGQSSQESVERLNEALVAAEAASLEKLEPPAYDEALTALIGAKEAFEKNVIPDQSKPPENKQPSNVEAKEEVRLLGWETGKEGRHSLHLKNRIVSFVDGVATITSELADELRKRGYIE